MEDQVPKTDPQADDGAEAEAEAEAAAIAAVVASIPVLSASQALAKRRRQESGVHSDSSAAGHGVENGVPAERKRGRAGIFERPLSVRDKRKPGQWTELVFAVVQVDGSFELRSREIAEDLSNEQLHGFPLGKHVSLSKTRGMWPGFELDWRDNEGEHSATFHVESLRELSDWMQTLEPLCATASPRR